VCEVVIEATDGAVMGKISGSLPRDLSTLVTAGSHGNL
jgi:hypothetical protein